MSGWMDSPIVRIGRDGDWFELGREPDSLPALHLYGSTGLGLPSVDIAKSDRITSDGSIVRGVRYTDREVFLPLLLEASTVQELNGIRQGMYDLMAPDRGLVEVQIEIPNGPDAEPTFRSIFGYLTEGLDGNFGDGYHGVWQTLGLTFTCPDPWWLGPEQTMTLQINPGVKHFISDTQEFFPVVLAESYAQGAWAIPVDGDSDVWPTWEVTGPGTDLIIQRGTERIFIKGEFRADAGVLRIDTERGRITPDRWADLSLDSRLFPLRAGINALKVSLGNATVDTTVRLAWRERYRGAI